MRVGEGEKEDRLGKEKERGRRKGRGEEEEREIVGRKDKG